ncbi:MAG: MobA/MobL family protein [Lachnospiraceae bacterium]|nr:MobA/MobL family protein [Lachnospiraceae bacterium]
MATKELSTRVDIIRRSKGQSAVDKAAYISRTTITSDYDGVTYYPKYSEDLVHSEIILPENAPKEYDERSVLWNSVEMSEKNKNAQLARMYKVSLPNDWSYEFAIEVMRDYINRNFVSEGMCADFAIHDSENAKHQRNLHCHIMLTMRGIDENGKWLPKKRKITLTDENGERIPIIDKKTGKQKVDKQNRKQWKTETVSTNDWDSPDNAKKWRADLARTINEANERIGLDEKWEHKSFKDRGLDILPTHHMGVKAMSLEQQGIKTEKGEYNRWVKLQNIIIIKARNNVESAIELVKSETAKWKITVKDKINEIITMVDNVIKRKGVLAIPVVKSKYVTKLGRRSELQDAGTVKQIVEAKNWITFEQIKSYYKEGDASFERNTDHMKSIYSKLQYLRELVDAYNEFKPVMEVHREYEQLKGLAQRKYKKEHYYQLEIYPELKARYDKLAGDNKTFRPKAWRLEIERLEKSLEEYNKGAVSDAISLATAEVILYNKRDLERQLENEERQKNRNHNRVKSKDRDI